MKLRGILLSACAVLALGVTAARADCAADLASLEAGAGGGAISKDGSVAPLGGTASSGGSSKPADAVATSSGTSAAGTGAGGAAMSADAGTSGGQGTTTNFESNTQTAANGAPVPAQSGGAIVKDGTTAPLAAKPGEASTGVANSDQDATAQQAQANGGTSSETTASVDGSSSMSPQMTAALDKARVAQQSGDEAACMAALDEARNATQ